MKCRLKHDKVTFCFGSTQHTTTLRHTTSCHLTNHTTLCIHTHHNIPQPTKLHQAIHTTTSYPSKLYGVNATIIIIVFVFLYTPKNHTTPHHALHPTTPPHYHTTTLPHHHTTTPPHYHTTTLPHHHTTTPPHYHTTPLVHHTMQATPRRARRSCKPTVSKTALRRTPRRKPL